MSHIYQQFVEIAENPEWGERWRIGGCELGREWTYALEICGTEFDLWFASKSDVDRAVEALKLHGITTGDDLDATPDEEIRRICYSALAW